MNYKLNLSSGPHTRDRWTTRFIMGVVALSLVPAAVAGVFIHGIHALWVILAAILASVGTEFVFDKLTGRPDTWTDLSAVVTGLMLALTLSPSVPLYIPILGGVFAIGVVKCCFGGLGKNFINPALAARCFLSISFIGPMTEFLVDGVSTATPVAALKAGDLVNVTRMFLGTTSGVIGSSVLALLVGGMVLWTFDFIHGQICFTVLGSFVLVIGLFGGRGFDPAFLAAHVCGGGVVLGAFFMATDYVTSPVSRLAQTVYGVIIGVLGALFRIKGQAADSFSYAIIVGNLFTPLIDTYIVSRPYAFRKRALQIHGLANRRTFRDYLPKPVIALAVIALVAGVALSGAFSMTKDTIEEQDKAKAAAAYQAVIPEAQEFSYLEEKVSNFAGQSYGTAFGRVFINEAVEGKDAAGNVIGYGVSVTSAEGYDGNLTVTVGLAPDGTVTAISYTELHETPGKGMLCDEPAFKDQFAGQQVTAFKIKENVDAVSGATVTSKATINAVNAALDFFYNVIRGD